ncbi:MAG: pitrilysin family protein [bacterium]
MSTRRPIGRLVSALAGACACLCATACAPAPRPASAADLAAPAAPSAPTPSAAREGFDPGALTVAGRSFERRILANGLTALAIRDPGNHAGQVSVFVVYAVGKRMEGPATTGIAHLTEHAMYAGTTATPAGQHDARVHALGGESNAYTRQDVTLYYDARVPTAQLSTVLMLEADRMRGLTFEPSAFEHERERLVAEEAATVTEGQRRDELLESLVFRAHPYGAGVLDAAGHTQARALTREQVRQFYDLWYHPNHAAVVVAGDVEPGDALLAIQQAFAAIASGPPSPPTPREPDDMPGGRAVVPSPSLTRERVTCAWVGPALDADEAEQRDRLALELLASALSNRKRGERRLLDAGVGGGVDRDLFVLSTTGAGAERELERVLAGARERGIDPRELERERHAALRAVAKRPLVSDRPYFSLAGTVGAAAALGIEQATSAYEERVRALTPENVREAARRWLPQERAWVVRFVPTDANAARQPLPSDPRELQRVAEEADASGELDRAIDAYQRLLAQQPSKMWTVIYLYELGSLRMRLGDLAGARRDLERGLALVDYPALRELLDDVTELETERGEPPAR